MLEVAFYQHLPKFAHNQIADEHEGIITHRHLRNFIKFTDDRFSQDEQQAIENFWRHLVGEIWKWDI